MPLPGIQGQFRVGTEPQLTFTQNGKAQLRFLVSAGKKRRDSDEYDNFNFGVSLWNEKAEELASILQQGDYIAITGGELSQRTYEKDGETKHVTDLNAQFATIGILPPRLNSTQGSGQQPQQPQGQGQQPFGAPQGQPPQFAPQQPQQPAQQPQGYPPQPAQQDPWGGQPQQGQQYPPQPNNQPGF